MRYIYTSQYLIIKLKYHFFIEIELNRNIESELKKPNEIHSPVSRRGRSLDVERDSRSSSKVATSSARANTTSTAEVSSNDVSNTVLTDVKPISVIFQPTHSFHTRDRSSSQRDHRVPCRDHIFFRFESSIYQIHCARA